MVDQRKFDELVKSTTSYLTTLIKRVDALEAEVKALKVKAPAKKETAK